MHGASQGVGLFSFCVWACAEGQSIGSSLTSVPALCNDVNETLILNR